MATLPKTQPLGNELEPDAALLSCLSAGGLLRRARINR